MGVETEDVEVVIARLDAVTMPILAKYTEKEYKRLLQDVQQGKMSEFTTKLTGIKECFAELSVNQGIILRGERLLIHQAQARCAGSVPPIPPYRYRYRSQTEHSYRYRYQTDDSY